MRKDAETITTLIPARAGSKRVPYKNTRIVAGKPMVAHAIEAAPGRILVDTDDPQVASIALAYGAEVVARDKRFAGDDATIDDLVRTYLPWQTQLLVLQPTVLHPQLPQIIEDFVESFMESGDESWSLGTPFRHLLWVDDDMPPLERVNSQDIVPMYQEIGCRIYSHGVTDPAPQQIWPVEQVFDIDTHQDLAAVRAVMERKSIIFRVVANNKVGSGHLYRCLALAAELGHHDIGFHFVTPAPSWATSLVKPWQVLRSIPKNLNGTLIVNDTLDTTIPEMAQFKAAGAKIVGFEDLGPGASLVDLLVNDLYPYGTHHNELKGPKFAILRPEFAISHRTTTNDTPRLLITFGGVDPARITERATRELYSHTDIEIRIIPPPGRKVEGQYPFFDYLKNPPMAAEMAAADLVLTSGGRTVWEAAAVGTPVVSVLQNPREQSHVHMQLSDGVVNLGPAALLAKGEIRRTIESLLCSDGVFLNDLKDRIQGLVDGKGARRVAVEIEKVLLQW